MDKVDEAIERIKLGSQMSLRYYGLPLVVTYSGGKDSDVIIEIAKMAGIPFEVVNSHTTADAPETVKHIRKKFYQLELDGIKCSIYKPMYKGKRTSMWDLISQKLMPPTRIVRYCCQVLKETSCKDRMIVTGVRWEESNARAKRSEFEAIGASKKKATGASKEIMLSNDNAESRKIIERCELKAKTVCNPIVDFKEKDVWDLLHDRKVECNPLYCRGYDRVGCIGCPMAGKKRYREFDDYPKYKQAYINAFDKMLEFRRKKGLKTDWECGEEVFLWWMEDKNVAGQMSIEDFVNFNHEGKD